MKLFLFIFPQSSTVIERKTRLICNSMVSEVGTTMSSYLGIWPGDNGASEVKLPIFTTLESIRGRGETVKSL